MVIQIIQKISRNSLSLLIYLFLGLLLSDCQKQDSLYDVNRFEKSLIVYIVGANNLSLQADSLISQMNYLSIPDNCSLRVFVDNFNTKGIYEYRNHRLHLLKTFNSDVSSLSPQFIKTLLADYDVNANERGVVFWSHGTGWIYTDLGYTRSFGDDRGKVLNITELADSLPFCYDYIVFDACYMGSVEVAYELINSCRYLVASPDQVAVEGIMNNASIESLFDFYPLSQRLRQVCDMFIDRTEVLECPANISVINIDAIHGMLEKLDKLSDLSYLYADASGIYCYTYRNKRVFFDMGCIRDNIMLDNVVEYTRNNINSDRDLAGLSVYIPTFENKMYIDGYGKIKWEKEIKWLKKFSISGWN